MTAVVFAEFMNLSMTVMTGGYAIGRTGGFNLVVFQLAVCKALIFESGLKKSTAAAATVIVRLIGVHINEILITHNGFDNKPQIVGNGVTVTFAHDLTGILDRKLDFQVLVPVGIDLQFAFPDPFGVVFIDVFDDEVVLDVEFFQSCQD